MGEPTTFIKLDRAILDHWVNARGEYDIFHAWVYILLNANYKEVKRYYKGSLQVVRRGELVTSERKLAEDWGWSKRRVHGFLDALQSDNMVSIKRTTDGTSIFVENYEKYQGVRTTDDTAEAPRTAPQTDHGRTADCTHNKNIKKDKERKERKEDVFSAPEEDVNEAEHTPPEILAELAKCIGGPKK